MTRAMTSLGLTVCVAVLQSALGVGAWGQTTVPGGEVSGTWTVGGSPYRVEGGITIPDDSVLVIEPGVTVEFQGHYELLVNGSLRAIGTETDTILFTVSDTTGWSDPDTTLGGWKHIRLFEPVATNDSTILDYCRIQFGKAIGENWPFNHGGAISVVGFDKVRISRSLIVNNMSGGPSEAGPAGGGIGVTSCDIAIVGNTVAYNSSHAGGGIHLSQSNSAFGYNTIANNSALGDGGGVEILGDLSRPAVVLFLGDVIQDNAAGANRGGISAMDVDSLILTSVILRGNHAIWGGGIGAAFSGMFLTDCLVEENQVAWLGGGIAADYCSATLEGTEFLRNRSQDAAGAVHYDHCSALLSNCSFVENHSGNDTLAGPAGGVNAFASVLDIRDCEFRGNVTAGVGGGVSVDSTTLSMENSEMAGNAARFAGGAIHAYRSTLELQGSALTGNLAGDDSTAGFGGGVRLVEVGASFTGCQLDSNLATGFGGGTSAHLSSWLLEASSVSANRAFWSGGGVDATEGGFSVEDCEITGNAVGNDTTFGVGGGIRTWGGSVLIRGSQIDSNSATGTGGGISATSDDYILAESSVSGNRSLGSGGGVQASQTKMFATSSELSGNVAGSDTLAANGGGMEAIWSDVDLDGCRILSNTASDGAGLNLFNSDLTVADASFDLNTARVNQGALGFRVDTTLEGRPFECRILSTLFQSNTAGNDVGALRIDQSATDSNQVVVTIDGCMFQDNQSRVNAALRIGGLARGIVLSRSMFLGNISERQAAGAGITRGHAVVSNCLFADNVAGSEADPVSGASFSAIQGARVDLINCTFTRNRSASASVLSMRTGAQVWLTNSVAWGNAGSPISLVNAGWAGQCDLWVNTSLVEGGEDSVRLGDSLCFPHWGTGNLDEDPLFRDAGADDFHLLQESPCIGAGIDSLEIDGHWVRAPVIDLEGNFRPAPAGTPPDMGAYEDGTTIPDDVETDPEGDLPVVYALHQNYPNPFNPATAIRFDLPEQAHVKLEVFDLLGSRVALLMDEKREAGRWLLTFSDPTLASGVYVYRLMAGSRVFTEKMLLLR